MRINAIKLYIVYLLFYATATIGIFSVATTHAAEESVPLVQDPVVDTKKNPGSFRIHLEAISAIQGAWGSGMDGVTVPSRANLGFTYQSPVPLFSMVSRVRFSHGRHHFGRIGHLLPLNDIAAVTLNDQWREDDIVKQGADEDGTILVDAMLLRLYTPKLAWMEWDIGYGDPRRWDRFEEGVCYAPLIMSGDLGFLSTYMNRTAPVNALEQENLRVDWNPHEERPLPEPEYLPGKNALPMVAFRLDPLSWFTFRGLLTLTNIDHHVWVRNAGIAEVNFHPTFGKIRSMAQIIWAFSDDHDSALHRFAHSMVLYAHQEIYPNLFLFGRYSVAEDSGVQIRFGTYRYQWQAGITAGFLGKDPKSYRHYMGLGIGQVAKIGRETAGENIGKTRNSGFGEPETFYELFYRIQLFSFLNTSIHFIRVYNQQATVKYPREEMIDQLHSLALRLTFLFR